MNDHLDSSQWGVRIDFLSTYAAEHADGAKISKELESMLGCQVSGDQSRTNYLEFLSFEKVVLI